MKRSDKVKVKRDQELGINFETGEVIRGEKALMKLNEMIFLLDSANQYNNMFPIEQSQNFMSELRERMGMGFTTEQFNEMKKAWSSGDLE